MTPIKVSRRDFVKIASVAATGLVLGVPLDADTKAGATTRTFDLGTFVQIDTDGIVTVWITKSEMGQGVRTSLPLLVAELDADLTSIRVRQALLDKRFGNQATGGSNSIRTMWNPLRAAGATARAMLVSAAAAKLGVDASLLTVTNGVIAHGTQKVGFGEVAEAASKLAVPKDVPLKDAANFKLIGKKQLRFDDPDIVTGRAVYGIDVRVPGMLYAVIARSPVFGGKVASFDATKAKAVRGVNGIVKVDAIGTDLPWNGVAVVADSTWAAIRGREALSVTWDEGGRANESSAALRVQMERNLASAKTVHNDGDVAAALAAATQTIESTYETPFLAHAPMEPMNATVHVRDDGIEVWAPTQYPNWAARSLASHFQMRYDEIRIYVTLLGGAFGRRINPDVILEAAQISSAMKAPVHLQWTREDDMRHGFYRPASLHRVLAGFDTNGSVIGWHHRFSAPAIASYYNARTTAPHATEIHTTDLVHRVPNFRIDFANADSGVPRGWWRSVEHSVNGFVFNSMLDELARAASRDVIDMHLSLLPKGERGDRLRRVIELVREKSGWRRKHARARGFAAWYSFQSFVAQVADVSVAKNGNLTVHGIVCAIDCGTAVNPDGVRAQTEGAILFGLSAAMGGAITIDRGRVVQSNFHDYPILTMARTPSIEIHIVPTTAPPTGAGEPGLPPAAAAVANAIFAATGKRVRSLPFASR